MKNCWKNFNMKNFQWQCQKHIFRLFWLHSGMFLALNAACFSAVTLFSATLCSCGLRTKTDPAWSHPKLSVRSFCFRVIKARRKGSGAASWIRPSGFTPCLCVCVWTEPNPLHLDWNTKRTHLLFDAWCLSPGIDSEAETHFGDLLTKRSGFYWIQRVTSVWGLKFSAIKGVFRVLLC